MSVSLYLCLHLRDFAAQAMECAQPALRRRPLAILCGTPPLEYVFAMNQQARELGVERGMSRMQAESFQGVALRQRERALEDRTFASLIECAGRFSPRIEIIAAPRGVPGNPSVGVLGWEEHSFRSSTPMTGGLGPQCEATLVLDIANSSRLLGAPEQIATAIERELRIAGFEANIAVSCKA